MDKVKPESALQWITYVGLECLGYLVWVIFGSPLACDVFVLVGQRMTGFQDIKAILCSIQDLRQLSNIEIPLPASNFSEGWWTQSILSHLLILITYRRRLDREYPAKSSTLVHTLSCHNLEGWNY